MQAHHGMQRRRSGAPRAIDEISQSDLTVADGIETNPQALAPLDDVLVVTADLQMLRIARPGLAIQTCEHRDDLMIVGQLEPDLAARSRCGLAASRAALEICLDARAIVANAHKQGRSDEQHETRFDLILQFGLDTYLIGAIDRNAAERRAVLDMGAFTLQGQATLTVCHTGHLRRTRLSKAPKRADAVAREIIRQRLAAADVLTSHGTANRPAQIAGQDTRPVVNGPFHGLHQRLAPQAAVAILIGVIDDPPVPPGSVDQHAVAPGPPRLRGRLRAQKRIVGSILPGTVDRSGAGHGDHVAGRRTVGAALGADQVEILASPEQLGTLEAEALVDPVVGIFPAVVHFLHGTDACEAVIRETQALTAAQEEIALAILAHHVARIDADAGAYQNRLAPGPFDVVGVHDIDADPLSRSGARTLRGTHGTGKIDEKSAVML